MSWIIHLFHSNKWKAFHQPQWVWLKPWRPDASAFLHWVILHFGCSSTVLSSSLCHLSLSSLTGSFLLQPCGLEAPPALGVEWGGGTSLLVFSMAPFGLNFTRRDRMLPLCLSPWPCFMSHLATQVIKCFSTKNSRMSRAYGLPVALTCYGFVCIFRWFFLKD